MSSAQANAHKSPGCHGGTWGVWGERAPTAALNDCCQRHKWHKYTRQSSKTRWAENEEKTIVHEQNEKYIKWARAEEGWGFDPSHGIFSMELALSPCICMGFLQVVYKHLCHLYDQWSIGVSVRANPDVMYWPTLVYPAFTLWQPGESPADLCLDGWLHKKIRNWTMKQTMQHQSISFLPCHVCLNLLSKQFPISHYRLAHARPNPDLPTWLGWSEGEKPLKSFRRNLSQNLHSSLLPNLPLLAMIPRGMIP